MRLFWYTRGKGTEDVGLVDTVAFPNPQTTDQRTFRFALPEAPYSFSGKLISIIWAIELILEPGPVGRAPRDRHVPERTGGRGRA